MLPYQTALLALHRKWLFHPFGSTSVEWLRRNVWIWTFVTTISSPLLAEANIWYKQHRFIQITSKRFEKSNFQLSSNWFLFHVWEWYLFNANVLCRGGESTCEHSRIILKRCFRANWNQAHPPSLVYLYCYYNTTKFQCICELSLHWKMLLYFFSEPMVYLTLFIFAYKTCFYRIKHTLENRFFFSVWSILNSFVRIRHCTVHQGRLHLIYFTSPLSQPDKINFKCFLDCILGTSHS